MQEKYRENKYRDLLICVDGYDHPIPTGWLVYPGLGRAVRFHGTVRLLRDVETLLDELRFPETFSRLRRFRLLPEATPEPAATVPDTGRTGHIPPANSAFAECQLTGDGAVVGGAAEYAVSQHTGAAVPSG
ncbi:hypothetical protein OBV_06710 [Oscillibacter valericigenes Sjm18-20]|nr:hypothetical protein OBV_06710 [Oscillibacter valericigenes Sjm18-20]